MRIGAAAALSLEKSSVKIGVPGWGVPGRPGTVANAGWLDATTTSVEEATNVPTAASADVNHRRSPRSMFISPVVRRAEGAGVAFRPRLTIADCEG
ncbi:hypothetical protein HNR22_001340 [Micromonospora jinlongensis]|uniref:Uncharacterized protein n=1 Tax=Micromonospora jinlongensis TaxID=1287877 RepID=A0A7Y9WYB4_9ACTN|nr:hypothetical protein [Micromonospora jinlongensis]NYH41613.1 hypothetical protein [Micromonospora jinlongensis]